MCTGLRTDSLFKRVLSGEYNGWTSPPAEAQLLPVNNSDHLDGFSDGEDYNGYVVPETSATISAHRRRMSGAAVNGDTCVNIADTPGKLSSIYVV